MANIYYRYTSKLLLMMHQNRPSIDLLLIDSYNWI